MCTAWGLIEMTRYNLHQTESGRFWGLNGAKLQILALGPLVKIAHVHFLAPFSCSFLIGLGVTLDQKRTKVY